MLFKFHFNYESETSHLSIRTVQQEINNLKRNMHFLRFLVLKISSPLFLSFKVLFLLQLHNLKNKCIFLTEALRSVYWDLDVTICRKSSQLTEILYRNHIFIGLYRTFLFLSSTHIKNTCSIVPLLTFLEQMFN